MAFALAGMLAVAAGVSSSADCRVLVTIGVFAQLRTRGFDAEVFTDPDVEGQLLVITPQPSVSDSTNDQWDRIAEIVEAAGGEYDGWETEVG
jgi:hypothetical protein